MKPLFNICRCLLLAGTLLGASRVSLTAADLSWGSDVPSDLFDASGTALSANFFFDIGVFETGFTPTAANLTLWASNWRAIDRTYVGDGNGEWNPTSQYFTGFTTFDSSGISQSPDATPSGYSFSAGQQIYLWVYNSQDYKGDSEWALVSRNQPTGSPTFNDWLMPDPNSGFSSQLLLQEADQVVFGGLNNVQGAGAYEVGNTPPTFDLQTHVIPEPSAAALIAALGIALRLRRRATR